MKTFALLLLTLPLAACATSSGLQSASNAPCTPRSHWAMATGCGAFAAYGGAYAKGQPAGHRVRNEPGPSNEAGGIGRGDLYTP